MGTVSKYTVDDAAKLSGLSKTMVNYLCRHELLEPTASKRPGRGRARQYTFGDIVILRALCRLLDAGVSVARLKTALKNIKKYHPKITPNSLPAKYIVTDGKEVFFRHTQESLELLDSNGQMAFAFVIELGILQNEINAAIAQAG
ncbi:MerR family transcriptional regulator [Emcibacter sp.]|uniref:MerR family transcriptional regulator n=1 Tax=Emcibacter sp. TaxID=1979954 RepID=UPI003A8D95D9